MCERMHELHTLAHIQKIYEVPENFFVNGNSIENEGNLVIKKKENLKTFFQN